MRKSHQWNRLFQVCRNFWTVASLFNCLHCGLQILQECRKAAYLSEQVQGRHPDSLFPSMAFPRLLS